MQLQVIVVLLLVQKLEVLVVIVVLDIGLKLNEECVLHCRSICFGSCSFVFLLSLRQLFSSFFLLPFGILSVPSDPTPPFYHLFYLSSLHPLPLRLYSLSLFASLYPITISNLLIKSRTTSFIFFPSPPFSFFYQFFWLLVRLPPYYSCTKETIRKVEGWRLVQTQREALGRKLLISMKGCVCAASSSLPPPLHPPLHPPLPRQMAQEEERGRALS
eukprot:GHVT01049932.1.p1 GENE.GHVT01049932.1~~GHVT01049932.1.p1  ORF type:complete len:216 (+),score=19.47 GHVT01049932.1:143-790(+)